MQQTIQNAQLNILEQGEGNPSLVFLHYFAGSSESWSEVIIQLQKTNHCIAPDLPGFGDSQPIKEPTVEAVSKIIAELIHQLDLQHYILIGHSMGGKVALALAANQPSGLRSLILLAPSPPTPEPIEPSERSRLLKTHGNRLAAEETAHKITSQPLSDIALDRVIQDNLRSSRIAWQAWLECGSRQDISSVMSDITVPVLVIVGADDPVIPKSLLEQDVIDSIANAQLVIVPNAGHLLPIETPQAIVDLIQAHIRKHQG
ncbi:MAG: alpha/beta hydrolase [Phormidesmis sp. CAN_BIN44]|nr:alpha/beta hydrolase [Phormidesmis sp. CAN_BIN44]